MTELKQKSFGRVFDADNHYWETHEAFTRYRDPKFRDRGLQLIEHEGVVRYFMNGQLWPLLPGPGDLHKRPVPGSMVDFFAGREFARSIHNRIYAGANRAPGIFRP